MTEDNVVYKAQLENYIEQLELDIKADTERLNHIEKRKAMLADEAVLVTKGIALSRSAIEDAKERMERL